MKVLDSKVRRPIWGSFGPGGATVRCIAIAAMSSTVFLGDFEGNLTKWDMKTNKTETIHTESGPIRRLAARPIHDDSEFIARVAVLSSNWKCTIYELNKL